MLFDKLPSILWNSLFDLLFCIPLNHFSFILFFVSLTVSPHKSDLQLLETYHFMKARVPYSKIRCPITVIRSGESSECLLEDIASWSEVSNGGAVMGHGVEQAILLQLSSAGNPDDETDKIYGKDGIRTGCERLFSSVGICKENNFHRVMTAILWTFHREGAPPESL
jgi:hypothetical protein